MKYTEQQIPTEENKASGIKCPRRCKQIAYLGTGIDRKPHYFCQKHGYVGDLPSVKTDMG